MSEIKYLPYQSEDNYFVQLIPDVQFTRFANGTSLKMNILRPVSDIPLPLIVWIVGGSWLGADYHKHVPILSELAKQGYVIASIEYRTANQAHFPAQLEDVKTAIRFLKAHAEEYGIDSEHVGVWGHSAGAHLASLAGVTGDQPEWDTRGEWSGYSSRVTAVVDLCGPTDVLTDFTSEYALPVISLLLGGPVRDKADNAALSNPAAHIRSRQAPAASLPPFLIMHGDADEMVPLRQSQFLYDALKEADARADMYILEGVKHSSTYILARPDVIEIISNFFARYLKGA